MNNISKLQSLIDLIKSYNSVMVAFSGGVDSTVLSKACQIALKDKAIAITVISPLMSKNEIIEAQKIANLIGIKHQLLHFNDLADDKFTANDKMRCYYCHINRFKSMENIMQQKKINYLLEGSNEDDNKDYRPGMLALKEFNFTKSPFLELHITKKEIRQIAKEWNLPVWNKPSSACLASRLVYGLPITNERLYQIDKAEEILRQIIPQGQIRVRHHGDLARIEIDEKFFSTLINPSCRQQINLKFKKLGFKFITIDLNGYNKGSNNLLLK